ncbi:MAG TPA: T9SS type A sorting domain-containing protein, partial [Flavobacteriales bacterium]|nr:T9SS type A sorting domain-containing protein [Flavobacteriales bacterium]
MREFIGSQLITPLIPGQQVHVSFKVSLARNVPGGNPTPRYATDRIGILFLTHSLNLDQFDTTVFGHAHVYTASVILDPNDWTTISGSFTSDSAYTHLAIGNFFPDDSLNLVISDPGGSTEASYYYVDDICVSMSPQGCALSTGIIQADRVAVAAWIADEVLTITGSFDPGHLEVHLLDPAGRLVFSRTLQGGGRITIPLGRVPPGLYVLSVWDGKGHQRIKIFA